MNETINMEQKTTLSKTSNDKDAQQVKNETITHTEKYTEECIELKNIEYQTMLLNKNNGSSTSELRPKHKTNLTLKDVNEILDSEKHEVKLSWSRLTKTNKLKKIAQYIETLKEKYDLEQQDIKDIKIYVKKCFDRKMLSRAKQIIYDKNKGIITDIPSLIILSKDNNMKNRKRFTLKLNETKTSTLKNLSKGKTSSRNEFMRKILKKNDKHDKQN